MGFLAWLMGRNAGKTAYQEISCAELFDAAADYTARRLAYDTCVNLVANALGLCTFRTYRGWKEVKESEFWKWNFEPGINQNASTFRHKLVDRLYRKNQALIVPTRVHNGMERFAVADDWTLDEEQVTRENQYRDVRVENFTFKKTFRESEVLRIKLHHCNAEPVIRAMGESWDRMVDAARKNYLWDHGQHWKVHVSQIASGQSNFAASFSQMIEEQVKPFFDSEAAVLPEFDGYSYELQEGKTSGQASDLRVLVEDIFNWTALGFGIPCVLVNGKVENTKDANNRFLTYVLDPAAVQFQEEITRKVYGFDAWQKGDFLVVDTSSVLHYDLFGEAVNLEKLVGSGVYNIDDLRLATGQSPLNTDWSKRHYMTLNIKPVDQVTEPIGE